MLFKIRFIVIAEHQNIDGKIRYDHHTADNGNIIEDAKSHIVKTLLTNLSPRDIVITSFKQVTK